jgi:hypothetical protein
MDSTVVINLSTAALWEDQFSSSPSSSQNQISDAGSSKKQKTSEETVIKIPAIVRDAETFMLENWALISLFPCVKI